MKEYSPEMQEVEEELKKDIAKYRVKEELNELRNERFLKKEREIKGNEVVSIDNLVANPDQASEIIDLIEKDKEKLAKRLILIDKSFSNLVEFVPGEIILFGAKTGRGKSTLTSGIGTDAIKQKKRVLIISNEESRQSVFTRIACSLKSLSYYKFRKGEFSDMENKTLNRCVKYVSKFLTVVSIDYLGKSQYCNTAAGIEFVLNASLNTQDLIIVDYYQKIGVGDQGQINAEQDAFTKVIDRFKNSFSGPILVMAQLNPDSDHNKDFVSKLIGLKKIALVATQHIEIITNRKKYTTKFTSHKNRHGASDQVLNMGFDRDKGTYVPNPQCNLPFQANLKKWKAEASQAGLESIEESDEGFIDDLDTKGDKNE